MSKIASAVLSYPALLWARIYQFLNEHADRKVDAWGASLQYKRRYTNPDVAKRYRQGV